MVTLLCSYLPTQSGIQSRISTMISTIDTKGSSTAFQLHSFQENQFLPPMTKINETVALKIKTLRDAGFGYKRIANQQELKAGTVKKHCQN
jgi:hypothetical protein